LPLWRLALERAVAPLLCVALLYASLSTDDAYSLAAPSLELRPTAHVATHERAVGVIVRTAPADAPALARRLAVGGVHLSFAMPAGAAEPVAAGVAAAGDDVVPELPGPAPLRWLGTREGLRGVARADGQRVYLAPAKGLSFGQFLLARTAHARAVTGQERFAAAQAASAPLPSAGDVVVVTADGAPDVVARELLALPARLSAAGLRAEPLSALLASASGSTNDRTAGDRSSASAQATTIAIPASTPAT
jgi:hypothetical protein